MSVAHRIQESEFCLEGSVSGFILGDKGEAKYLNLETGSGLYRIKLEKSLRRSPQVQALASQTSVRVSGTRKVDPRKGTLKLKAYKLECLNAKAFVPNRLTPESLKPDPLTPVPLKTVKAKILVCQKSSCRKRGAQKVCSALQQNLIERGLTEAVKIVETGCMKDCKSGPHIVIMPERKRYAHSSPFSLEHIFDQHFPGKSLECYLPQS